ncbi:MAG TPA: HEPN domain-containing protein [Spirochaetia bacterium]|nr:HEPN domain-containing protein [Spirochaetia bacterium]
MSPDRPDPDAQTVGAMEAHARSRLSVARELFAAGHFEDAVSRAYYAAFHSATLLFYCMGRVFSSHAQLVGAFNKELVLPGILPVELARSLRDLFELRQAADYDVHNTIEGSEADSALNLAEAFVNQVLDHARSTYPGLFNPAE